MLTFGLLLPCRTFIRPSVKTLKEMCRPDRFLHSRFQASSGPCGIAYSFISYDPRMENT